MHYVKQQIFIVQQYYSTTTLLHSLSYEWYQTLANGMKRKRDQCTTWILIILPSFSSFRFFDQVIITCRVGPIFIPIQFAVCKTLNGLFWDFIAFVIRIGVARRRAGEHGPPQLASVPTPEFPKGADRCRCGRQRMLLNFNFFQVLNTYIYNSVSQNTY